MKKLISILMCLVLLTGCSMVKESAPTETTEATEATLSPMQSSLVLFVDGFSSPRPEKGISLSYENNSVVVSTGVSLDEIESLFTNTESVTRKDPEMLGVKERLSYTEVTKADGKKVDCWHFFADVDSDSNEVKWVELDARKIEGSQCLLSINGISVGSSFSDVLTKWGIPNYYDTTIYGGEEVICSYWETAADEMGAYFRVFVYLNNLSDEDVGSSTVYSVYAQRIASVD
jgi:hypothetical protein